MRIPFRKLLTVSMMSMMLAAPVVYAQRNGTIKSGSKRGGKRGGGRKAPTRKRGGN